MASRMRIWLGIVVGGILLIGSWGLPPQTYEEWRAGRWGASREPLPERRAFQRVSQEVARMNWVYQRLQWRDSLVTLARTAREGERHWVVALPDSATPGLAEELEGAVIDQLQARGIQELQMPVGVVLMDRRTGSHPRITSPGSINRMELVLGRDPEDSFCFLVQPVPGPGHALEQTVTRMVWTPADGSAPPSPLGPCALPGKYGQPGPEVLQWLSQGRFSMGLGGSRMAFDFPRATELPLGARLALGNRFVWLPASPSAGACLAGRMEGCRAVLFEDGPASSWAPVGRSWSLLDDVGVVTRVDEYGYSLPLGGLELGLLWDLESDFGPERFRAFWTSPLGVEEAFQEAFGVSFPRWLMEWGQTRIGGPIRGAGVPLNAALLSFLSIGLLAGAALFLGRRRG